MRLMTCLMLVALAACATPSETSADSPKRGGNGGAMRCAVSIPSANAEVARQVNALRARRGLSPIRLNSNLNRIAQSHACDNAARRVYSHTGGDGSTLGTRLNRGGYNFRSANESTGLGRFDSSRMVAFWRDSPAHYANLMAPAVTEAGLGTAATRDGRNAWVLVLATRG